MELLERSEKSVVKKNHKSNIINHKHTMSNDNNKQIWSKVLQVIITILTAIATTFGVTSCMGM